MIVIRAKDAPFQLLLVLLSLLVGGMAAGDEEAEYALKAAFIRNFFQFIKWPQGLWPPPGEPVTVCVLGQDPFGDLWDQGLGRVVGEHTLTVRRLTAPQAGGCHMLFIARSEEGALAPLLAQVNRSGLLTVADTPGFARQGGMINFYLWQDKVRFEINAAALRRAGLVASSKLLGLARLVDEGGPP